MHDLLLAHKIELRPTAKQEEFLAKSCGVRRFVWNKCLAEWNWAYRKGLKPNREYILFFYKCLRNKYSWLKEVSSVAGRNAVYDLVDAFQKYFKGQAKHPRFKKKHINESFGMKESIRFRVNDRKLKIEKLKTLIPMRQEIRFIGEHRQCTISQKAGKWFASILVKLAYNPFNDKMPSENQVGVDLGVKDMAVLSDGSVFPANQPLKKKLDKLAQLQKRLSKKVEGSNRYYKLKRRIAKLYYYITCKRKAIIHEFTDYLTRMFKIIKIEDLNISGMLKNHKLARAIADVGFFEIRRQLEYKANLRSCILQFVDRWFPSSKLCSQCGCIKEDLTLADRIFKCDCGLEINRDLNAAINILNYSPGQNQAGLKTCTSEQLNKAVLTA